MSVSYSLTLGGLAIALTILLLNVRTWWKSPGRDPKVLGPFTAGFALGALATICTGGLLGWLAGCTAGITNSIGSKAVPGATGTGDDVLASGSLGTLTAEGGVIVFLLAVGVFFAWKAASKELKRRMAGGLICGATLCLTAGIAGALDWLPELVNGAGQQVRAAVEGSLG